MVYIPQGWWHAVVNVESSVAITENFVHPDVLQAVVDDAVAVSGGGGVSGGGEEKKVRRQVTTAIIRKLDLVEEDEWGSGPESGCVWDWLFGLHKDGILDLGACVCDG